MVPSLKLTWHRGKEAFPFPKGSLSFESKIFRCARLVSGRVFVINTVDGWNPANQLRLVVYAYGLKTDLHFYLFSHDISILEQGLGWGGGV